MSRCDNCGLITEQHHLELIAGTWEATCLTGGPARGLPRHELEEVAYGRPL